MPVGFNSPARNLFLLGSSGTQVVSNFFESISKASTTDGGFIPDEIRYIDSSKKYALAGSAQDSNTKEFGWFERQDYELDTGNLTTDYSVRIESTDSANTSDTSLRAMELDSNENLIVVGKTINIPWIAKYSNAGVLDWQSTTNSADVEYTGITSDSSGNYYACGSTPTSGSAQAFVEKFDSNGNPGWGKSAFMLGRDVVLEKISANSGGHVVAVGYLEDDSADKGYIVKIDTATGEVLWDRTLERNISGFGEGNPSVGGSDDITPAEVRCTACYIDSRDQIYVVGTINGNPPVDNGIGEFLIKYSPEGNIIWQRERGTRDYTLDDGAPNIVPFDVKSDGETEQTVVLSVEDFGPFALFNSDIFLSKYSKNGDLVFRRRISKGQDNLGAACLDADPSFYYIMFRDQRVNIGAGEPDRYTFGKVSTSGNGFGAFQYDDGEDIIDYTVITNAENKIGRLSDGSVTNSVSDLMTYPFTANKLVFDDLATHVSNKKRQMDDADSFEYSGSPAIRPADFQELNLLGDVYSGSGDWVDQSGKGNDGVVNGPTHNAAGYWEFDGTDDYIQLPTNSDLTFAGDFSYETWLWTDVQPASNHVWSLPNGQTFQFTTLNSQQELIYYSTETFNQSFGPLANNTWAHYVITKSGNTLTGYLNGVEAWTSTPGSSVTHNFSGASIGYRTLSPGNQFYWDGRMGEIRIYPRALTAAAVFQNYNATKSKYINEAPDTAPKISSDGYVIDSNLLLNYDFGNRATYDNVNNLLPYSADIRNSQTNWARAGVDIVSTDLKGPFGERGVVGLVEQTNNGQHTLYDDMPYVYFEGNYTSSCWIKPGTRSYAEIFVNGAGAGEGVLTVTGAIRFNFNDGTTTNFGATNPAVIFTEGPDGWWFCGIKSVIEGNTAIPGQSGTYRFHIRPATASTGDYQGDDSAPAIYIIHPQVSEDSGFGKAGDLSQNIRYVPTYNGAIQSTTVKNLSSSSYPSTIDGAEFNTAGYFVFDNANNDEIISSQSTIADTGMPGLTVEVWANLSSSTVFGTDGTSWLFGEEGRYRLVYGSTSIQWVCATANNAWYTAGTVITPTASFLDGWHHIVGVYDGTNVRLDLDGTTLETSTSAISGNVSTSSDPQMSLMGTDAGNVGWGTGSIGQVRIYNTGLTNTQILQNFNATRGKYGV